MKTDSRNAKKAGTDRHWIRFGEQPWQEVSKERYNALMQKAAETVGFEIEKKNGGDIGIGSFSIGSVKGQITPREPSYRDFKHISGLMKAVVRKNIEDSAGNFDFEGKWEE